MKFWIKYIAFGLVIALAFLLFVSNSQASLEIRRWIAHRFVFAVTEQKQLDSSQLQYSFADAIAKTSPAVVSIQSVTNSTVRRNPNARNYDELYLYNVGLNYGSGVIIDEKGYVVTNFHVIKDASSISVHLPDGRQKIATVIGSDPVTDLTVLHIELDNLPTPLFNNDRETRPGDIVFAIGNPYGQFDKTVTMGIVSATRSPSIDGIPELLQVDAAIHPGNSGGALINAHGELIGITSMQLTPNQKGGAQTGISFSLPYKAVANITSDLIENGKIQRGYLGFSSEALTRDEHDKVAPEGIPYGKGFRITAIDPTGPAQLAGLKPFDYVTHINDEAITSFRRLLEIMSSTKVNDKMIFTTIRGKETLIITIQVSDPPTYQDSP